MRKHWSGLSLSSRRSRVCTNGAASVSYNATGYLADRHHLADDLRSRLAAIDAISDAAVSADIPER
jgi:hypothetical protein